ncbi:hypothetical protein [Tumebacillus permanentifrigoris]|uniref:hypothetical protein n=1 Tax=Tumebacillus permanentifrigoris TaxID=378543 RepID=UPI000D6A99F7|nr:hypothetical protein [Tumebacillus permanentifrigoris]
MLFDCLLDGMYVNHAAAELGFSRQYAHRIKSSLIRKLAWSLIDQTQPPATPAAGEAARPVERQPKT